MNDVDSTRRPAGPWGDELVSAVETGEVSPVVLDDHVRRLLRLASRVGALGASRSWPEALPEPDGDVRRDQLTRLAAGGMTVLRNGGALPLAPGRWVALALQDEESSVALGSRLAFGPRENSTPRTPVGPSVKNGLEMSSTR